MNLINRWGFDEQREMFTVWLSDLAPFEKKTYVYYNLDAMTFDMDSTGEGTQYHPIFEVQTVYDMLVSAGRDVEAGEFKAVVEWLEKQVWQDCFLEVVSVLLNGPSIHPKLAWKLKRLAEWYVESSGNPSEFAPNQFYDLHDGYGLHARWKLDIHWGIHPEAKSR